MQWTKEKTKKVIELKNSGLTWAGIAEEMSARYDERYTVDSCRGRYRNHRHTVNEEQPAYKETIEHKGDNQVSDKLIALSDEELKDANSLLKAHNYDPSQWELMNSKSSMWHHSNKEYGTKTLYASKITVKPKNGGFNFDELLDTIKDVPKYNIGAYINNKESYLSIPLSDMHFGVATIDDYKETQNKILEIIGKQHQEILFIIGNDMLHHDNLKGTTANGTRIQDVDMVKAWEDAKLFYYPLLEYALQNSNKVKVVFTKGNHSESMEYAFIQMLKERYKQIEFDDSLKDRKVHMLGLNYIGTSHGDKKKMNQISNNFAVEYPQEWSKAKTRTVFVGHYHFEKVHDRDGIVIRQLPTRAPTDDWHDDNGYTTAAKRFQVFQYDYDSERCIHYV